MTALVSAASGLLACGRTSSDGADGHAERQRTTSPAAGLPTSSRSTATTSASASGLRSPSSHPSRRRYALRETLTPPNAAPLDHFGETLALDGDLLAVGAPRRDDPSLDAGVVYIYERDDGRWQLAEQLRSPVGGPRFGETIALHRNVLVVSSRYPRTPPQWFERIQGKFERRGAIPEPPPWPTGCEKLQGGQMHFGSSLELRGSTLLVGAQGDYGRRGRAYLLVRQTRGWQLRDEVSSDRAAQAKGCDPYNFYLGLVGTFNSRWLVLTAGEDPGASIHAFARSDQGDWQWRQRLGRELDDVYGKSIALAGEWIIAAAKRGARVYRCAPSDGACHWREAQQLGDKDTLYVGQDGDLAVLSHGDVYRVEANRFVLWQSLGKEPNVVLDGQGAVAIRGNTIAVGAQSKASGVVYVFESEAGARPDR